jgi:hypothetical protein
VNVLVLDTFPLFTRLWAEGRGAPVDEQIDRWLFGYAAAYPELVALQQEDYARQGLDWRQIARERVFPFLAARLPAMRRAHRSLLAVLEPSYARAMRALEIDLPIVFVIHVGIGCGAGWATSYTGGPAVLFGLENIAESGWTDRRTLASLVTHEVAHLAHAHWRRQAGFPPGAGPWWQLIEEGFAQRCEMRVLGRGSRRRGGSDRSWLAWCRRHRAHLAREWLRAVDAGEPVYRFFGSWLEIRGHPETGYFLGEEVVALWERELSLPTIAALPLDEIERCARLEMESFAATL